MQVIQSLPFTGNGTTDGYSSDYQPTACTGTTQAAKPSSTPVSLAGPDTISERCFHNAENLEDV